VPNAGRASHSSRRAQKAGAKKKARPYSHVVSLLSVFGRAFFLGDGAPTAKVIPGTSIDFKQVFMETKIFFICPLRSQKAYGSKARRKSFFNEKKTKMQQQKYSVFGLEAPHNQASVNMHSLPSVCPFLFSSSTWFIVATSPKTKCRAAYAL
jgi:hypothetical protein